MRGDGDQLVVPCVGFPFALNVIDHPSMAEQQLRSMPVRKPNNAEIQVHTGVVYSADGSEVYVGTGDSGAVDIYSSASWKKRARIALGRDAFAAGMVLDKSGKLLYVLDQGNWRVAVVDVAAGRVLRTFETGVNPMGLALSPDGGRLYVVNSGLFEYQVLPGVDRDKVPETGLHFAAFGYPSRAARAGGQAEGRQVPGLGSENSERGSSIWTYNLQSPPVPAKLRLGQKISERRNAVVGGAAPSAVVAGDAHVYVSLAHEDAIAVISADGRRVENEVPLSPFAVKRYHDGSGRPLRGVMPSGLALQGDRLYVAEAGINAVAAVDVRSNQVVRQWPVGWNPSAVMPSADGKRLYVVNTKGQGTGPNAGAGFNAEATGSYIGELAFGSVSVLELDKPDQSALVVQSNEAALASSKGLPRLKHVFLIIRENRTFDEVLGDLPGVNGDQAVARYGMRGWTEEKPMQKDLHVTPNAHALAEQFATSDNFYADSDVSNDGHRWLMGMAPTPWLNMAWTSNYGGRREGSAYSPAPGRRAMSGGADAPMPEDEPEFGSLWEHVTGAKLKVLNYGEGLEIEGSDERDGAEPEGQRNLLNAPVPRPVFESSDRAFPTFNLGIPDQNRVEEFERDFGRRMKRGDLPSLIVIRLPNDHTAEVRPGDGYPYRASFVADNDLATGRIISFLSKSRIWKDSAVFVTEDDAQGGRDHVDAHRTVLLVASPWVKPGYVSHRHASFVAIQKTIYGMLGLSALNLEDALAPDLSDLFGSTAHEGVFTERAADVRVFDPARARVAKPKTKAERSALLECDIPRVLRGAVR